MKTYMGAVYGIRHYTLGSSELPGSLIGATGRRWYSPRQKARCDFYDSIPAANIEHIGGQERHCPHESHHWREALRIEALQPHFVPALCGINMYNTLVIPGANRRQKLTSLSWLLRAGNACAITRGWGKIIIHKDGYRVEQALVTHLYVPDATLSIREMQRADLPFFLPGFVKRGVTFVDTLEEFEEAWKNVSNLLVPIPASESR